MNLDRICSEYGYKYSSNISQELKEPKKAENLITKALAVLQSQGLYAFCLFCQSRSSHEKNAADKLLKITEELLSKKNVQLIDEGKKLLEEMREENGLATKLHKLFLAIELLEQSLVYARYHTKALKNTAKQKENN